MKIILKLEYLIFLLMGILAFSETHLSWWWFLGLLLLPDVSMLGYAVNTKWGAFFYNIMHHYATAVVCYLLGMYFDNLYFLVSGSILFAHISFDRILGYGLKYSDHFKHTHLGYIGQKKDA